MHLFFFSEDPTSKTLLFVHLSLLFFWYWQMAPFGTKESEIEEWVKTQEQDCLKRKQLQDFKT